MTTTPAASAARQDIPASLANQLAEFKAGFASRATPERRATMEAATGQLRASGVERTALNVGDAPPDVTLPDASGKPVRLRDLWAGGTVVLVFYRGGWCPYCNLGLRAWQQQLPQLKALGATLVAVSPQTPDNSLSTAEKNALEYPVLSDSALAAARGFGVVFDLPPELVELYSGVGHDLPVTNGNGQWALPVPATYVVNPHGRIAYAHVDADYRNRAEPADVIALIATGRTAPGQIGAI